MAEQNNNSKPAIPPSLLPHLYRTPSDPRPVVLMTCGLAGNQPLHHPFPNTPLTTTGAGKTTLVQAVINQFPQFTRLSIDAIISDTHGLYGTDYPASPTLYAQYNNEADEIYLSTFRQLLAEGKDIAFERSCYAKLDRDEWRRIAEEGGARVVLVYLRAREKEVLWERICRRSEGVKTADNALEIGRGVFEGYWEGFEGPEGEGEVVVDVV